VLDLGKAAAGLLPSLYPTHLTEGEGQGAQRDVYDFLEVVGKALPLPAAPVPFIAGDHYPNPNLFPQLCNKYCMQYSHQCIRHNTVVINA